MDEVFRRNTGKRFKIRTVICTKGITVINQLMEHLHTELLPIALYAVFVQKIRTKMNLTNAPV